MTRVGRFKDHYALVKARKGLKEEIRNIRAELKRDRIAESPGVIFKKLCDDLYIRAKDSCNYKVERVEIEDGIKKLLRLPQIPMEQHSDLYLYPYSFLKSIKHWISPFGSYVSYEKDSKFKKDIFCNIEKTYETCILLRELTKIERGKKEKDIEKEFLLAGLLYLGGYDIIRGEGDFKWANIEHEINLRKNLEFLPEGENEKIDKETKRRLFTFCPSNNTNKRIIHALMIDLEIDPKRVNKNWNYQYLIKQGLFRERLKVLSEKFLRELKDDKVLCEELGKRAKNIKFERSTLDIYRHLAIEAVEEMLAEYVEHEYLERTQLDRRGKNQLGEIIEIYYQLMFAPRIAESLVDKINFILSYIKETGCDVTIFGEEILELVIDNYGNLRSELKTSNIQWCITSDYKDSYLEKVLDQNKNISLIRQDNVGFIGIIMPSEKEASLMIDRKSTLPLNKRRSVLVDQKQLQYEALKVLCAVIGTKKNNSASSIIEYRF